MATRKSSRLASAKAVANIAKQTDGGDDGEDDRKILKAIVNKAKAGTDKKGAGAKTNKAKAAAATTKGGATGQAKKVKSEAKKKRKPQDDDDDEPEDQKSPEKKMKSVKVKGKAPVDDHCPVGDKYHVYCDDDCIWDCMLNQTNIQNNNNKYYLIQLLKKDGLNQYSVWMRWGRVG